MSLKRSNGDGTIYLNNKRKRYECQFFYADPMTGEKKKKKLVGKTIKNLDHRRKEYMEQINKEHAEVLSRQSMAETTEEWLSEWLELFIKPTVRTKTYERYKCSIYNHIIPYIGTIPIDKLTAEDVQNMMNNMMDTGGKKHDGLSPRTINAARRTLKSALAKACHLRKIDFNPVDATKAAKTEKAEIHILSHSLAKKLLEVSKEHDQTAHMAILLALSTGMRLGEIFGLLWENIDFDTNLLYVKQSLVSSNHGSRLESSPKTKAGYRQIELPKLCLKELKAHRAWQDEQKSIWLNKYKDKGLVISNPDGGYKDPNYFSAVVFKRLLTIATINTSVRFHDLRHTHATWLLEKGVHPKVVAERLGHSSIRITLDTYSHVIQGMQKIAVNKLDEIAEKW